MRAKPITHEVEDLKKSLDAVGKSISSLSSVAIAEGKTRASEAGNDASRLIEKEVDLLRQKFNEVGRGVAAYTETLDHTVHEKPYWFIAAAGGLGFLLGKTLRRS